MNKNKCICIAALSGLISALSFNINCLWFAIFFSISQYGCKIREFHKINSCFSLGKLLLVLFLHYFCIMNQI